MTEPRNGPTVREYFERLFADHLTAHKEHQAAHDREHAAAQKAIDTASTLASQNKADANEWRDAMTDRERTFARADAVDDIARRVRLMESTQVAPITIETLRERVITLERINAQMVGALNIARFVGFGGLVMGAGAVLWVFTRGIA